MTEFLSFISKGNTELRTGLNPSKMKGSPAYQPRQVGVATLTYVPSLQGYFRDALDIIQVHLSSMRSSMDQEVNTMVFDNGSCPEVVRYLESQWQSGLIDWLTLSRHNLGKNGALNWIFSAMPNEYIAYSDSDVFFRSGWLEESLKIFQVFDRAGMVSAQPVFFDFLRGQGTTIQQIEEYAGDFSIAKLKPTPEIVEEYCDGIDASDELRKEFLNQDLTVAIHSKTGFQAVTTATDMQFMLKKEVIKSLVPLPIAGALTAKDAIDIPMGVEKLGYWLLSTDKPYVWHMGNALDSDLNTEIKSLFTAPERRSQTSQSDDAQGGMKLKIKSSIRRNLKRFSWLRRKAERLYGLLFSLLYEEDDP